MKRWMWTAVCLVSGTGAALAQDGDKKIDELKREFERSMKTLQEKFDHERARLEKEFKAAQEKLLGKRAEPKEKNEKRTVEGMLEELLGRVESLEKRLEKEVPRLRELPRILPHDFEFKNFGERAPEEWKKWMEQMPRWKGAEDFKFEFFRKKDKDGEPAPKKKDKKKDKDEDEKEYF